jgi:hypothetical protein
MKRFSRTRAASEYIQNAHRLRTFVDLSADADVWTKPENFERWLSFMYEVLQRMTIAATKVQVLGEAHGNARMDPDLDSTSNDGHRGSTGQTVDQVDTAGAPALPSSSQPKEPHT